MARNLQYLETPQYLRKHLFKLHADLKNAGLMNPIECHHHLLTTEPSEFREGVSLDRPVKKGSGSWVDIGLKQQARMDQLVPPLTRVTLKLQNFDDPDAPFYEAEAVSKKVPRQ
jgi:predicted SPOUT superfamily RNA methylase MTH1